jgi:TolB protein
MKRIGTALAMIAAAAGPSATAAWASFPGNDGVIAYTRYSTHHSGSLQDIWTVRPDGSHAHRLTRTQNRDEAEPAFSPKGKRIAFAGEGGGISGVDIYSMASNGTRLHRLTRDKFDEGDPAYSPSAKRIVFAVREGSPQLRYRLFTMHADGTHRKRLLPKGFDKGCRSPDWSPDGNRIAFDVGGSGSTPRTRIYVARTDGSEIHAITPKSKRAGEPSWSPDGRRIAFTMGRNAFSVRSDGDGLRRVTNEQGFGIRSGAVYSPSGTRIAFMDLAGDALVSVNALHGGQRRILATGNLNSPTWQPLKP